MQRGSDEGCVNLQLRLKTRHEICFLSKRKIATLHRALNRW